MPVGVKEPLGVGETDALCVWEGVAATLGVDETEALCVDERACVPV